MEDDNRGNGNSKVIITTEVAIASEQVVRLVRMIIPNRWHCSIIMLTRSHQMLHHTASHHPAPPTTALASPEHQPDEASLTSEDENSK